MMLTLDGRKVQPLVQTQFNEVNAEISPDGHWLAYRSNESVKDEVYVQPFPDVKAGKWMVSNGGGSEPLWSPNRRELFYRGPTGAVMCVPVELGTSFTKGTPVKLLDARYVFATVSIWDAPTTCRGTAGS
jgi:eukaryotic-like serine/threonine-protein kinase